MHVYPPFALCVVHIYCAFLLFHVKLWAYVKTEVQANANTFIFKCGTGFAKAFSFC